MATIVTRTGKGSALTFAEGDANFTNLNTDKLENISEDTTPQLGGDLDLNGNEITDSTGNPVIGGFQYPSTSGVSGNVSFVDDLRQPNSITLDGGDSAGIANGETVRFSGADAVSANLQTGVDYFIVAELGSDQFEIATTFNGTPITNLTDPGIISDFTYTAPDLNVSPTTGDILTWDGTKLALSSPAGGGISNLVEDTSPELGGDLNGAGNIVSDIELKKYHETIYDLGSTDTPSIDVANGNVQKVSISGGLTLPAFSNAITGQSVTLIVSGTGVASAGSEYKFAGGNIDLTTLSVVSIFYDGINYYTSIATDFQ